MRISDIIKPTTIAVGLKIDDKAQALKFISARLAARSGLDAERIREGLAAREELGSTGIGQGIALPHVCFSDLKRPYGLFLTLAKPIAFDSIDGEPVDVICAIISPSSSSCGKDQPISYLAAICRTLRDKASAAAIRKANNPWTVHDIVVRSSATTAQLVS